MLQPKRAAFRTGIALLAIGAVGVVMGLSMVQAGASSRKTPQAAERTDAAGSALLSGSIRAGDGKREALEGITVSARAVDKTITTTVFTDGNGEYAFPPLATGTYQVWAQAVGFATARADVKLDAARPVRQAFTLKTLEDFTPQLTSAEWLDALPERTRQERRMKEIFRVNCNECHSLSLALLNRFDEQGWTAIIERMDNMSGGDAIADGDGEGRGPVSTLAYHKKELAKYLTEMRGPGPSPVKFKLHARPTGEAARVVMTEYAIPPARTPNELVWADGVDWSKGPASGQHRATGTHDVNIDRDGNQWLTESSAGGDRTITKVDTKTGQVSGFKLKLPGAPGQLRAHGIGAKDGNGDIWFDTFGRLGRIDPKSDSFEIFTALPRQGGATLTTDADPKDPKGYIWAASRYGASRFDPATKKFKFYQSLTPADGNTYGVAVDSNGNGWWTTYWADILTTVDVKTGKSQEVPLDPPGASERAELATPADKEFYEEVGALKWSHINTVPGAIGPRRLGADKNSNLVWVPLFHANSIAKIDIKSRRTNYYSLPINSHPYFLVVDKNHSVWTNLMTDDIVARFEPKSEQWTFYRLPTHGCETRNIAVDDLRGEVWVPCIKASKTVRLQFRTAAQLQSHRGAPATDTKR